MVRPVFIRLGVEGVLTSNGLASAPEVLVTGAERKERAVGDKRVLETVETEGRGGKKLGRS